MVCRRRRAPAGGAAGATAPLLARPPERAAPPRLRLSACPADPQVQLLLAHRASVDVVDQRTGSSALLMASARGHTQVARLLLRSGADPNLATLRGNTALMVARTPSMARELIAGAKPVAVAVAVADAYCCAIVLG